MVDFTESPEAQTSGRKCEELSRQENPRWEDYPKCERHHSTGPGHKLSKKEVHWVPAFISFDSVPENTGCPISCSCCLQNFPAKVGCAFKLSVKINSFPSRLTCVGDLIPAVRKVTDASAKSWSKEVTKNHNKAVFEWTRVRYDRTPLIISESRLGINPKLWKWAEDTTARCLPPFCHSFQYFQKSRKENDLGVAKVIAKNKRGFQRASKN